MVPSLNATGPVKGAVALCNSLADKGEVTLVALKPGPAYTGPLHPGVRVVNLGSIGSWLGRLHEYRRMLSGAGGKARVASLSFCFSADVFNSLVRKHAVTASSVRGHLLRTYKVDYGPAGVLLAVIQFLIISRFDHVIAMTRSMAWQISRIGGKRPVVIGNFVEESLLEPHRALANNPVEAWRFVFIGRLCRLKMPDQVIEAVSRLREQGIPCSLDLFGDGPLSEALKADVIRRGLADAVCFHGQVNNPWERAANSHCLVLPSLTEGISRAALEALYLGVPCAMRDVDSNSEVIRPGENGELFDDTESLADAMSKAARLGTQLASTRPVLLGEQFRQEHCVQGYSRLLQES